MLLLSNIYLSIYNLIFVLLVTASILFCVDYVPEHGYSYSPCLLVLPLSMWFFAMIVSGYRLTLGLDMQYARPYYIMTLCTFCGLILIPSSMYWVKELRLDLSQVWDEYADSSKNTIQFQNYCCGFAGNWDRPGSNCSTEDWVDGCARVMRRNRDNVVNVILWMGGSSLLAVLSARYIHRKSLLILNKKSGLIMNALASADYVVLEDRSHL